MYDTAKFLYSSDNWDKLVNQESGLMKVRQTEAAKCGKVNEDMINGLICGFCEPEMKNRFVQEAKNVNGQIKTVWAIKFLLKDAQNFANGCQNYMLNQLKIFEYTNKLAYLFAFNRFGVKMNSNPQMLDKNSLGDDYTEANINSWMNSCKKEGSKAADCANVATKYMKLGISTTLDLLAIQKLVPVQNSILGNYNTVYNANMNPLSHYQADHQVKTYNGSSEPMIDFIAFQIMDSATKENPFTNDKITDFKAAADKNDLSNLKAYWKLFSVPDFWSSANTCPMAFVFNSAGTNRNRLRSVHSKDQFCSNMDRSCCNYKDIEQLSKSMRNVMTTLLKTNQNYVLFIRENLRLAESLISQKSHISKALIHKCNGDKTCTESLNGLIWDKKNAK